MAHAGAWLSVVGRRLLVERSLGDGAATVIPANQSPSLVLISSSPMDSREAILNPPGAKDLLL